MGDLLLKIDNEEVGKQSTSDWVRHVFPVGGMFQMFGQKLSNLGMLQSPLMEAVGSTKGKSLKLLKFM